MVRNLRPRSSCVFVFITVWSVFFCMLCSCVGNLFRPLPWCAAKSVSSAHAVEIRVVAPPRLPKKMTFGEDTKSGVRSRHGFKRLGGTLVTTSPCDNVHFIITNCKNALHICSWLSPCPSNTVPVRSVFVFHWPASTVHA